MTGTLTWARQTARDAVASIRSRDSRRIRATDRRGATRTAPRDDLEHLRAAADWICTAQDATDDDGVAAMYSFLDGWVPSYPETTGYIIPAMFDAGAFLNESALHDRAVRMAEWLLTVQTPDGAFPGLFVGSGEPPRVFNTGQIIFGLIRASRETGKSRYLDAAIHAGNWLLAQQGADGAWRTFTFNDLPHTYNARTAWALIELAAETDDYRFKRAGLAGAEWARDQQIDSGWFDHNSFDHQRQYPTLHTIVYATRGLLEIGARTGCTAFVDAATRTATALLNRFRRDGRMFGIYEPDFSSPVQWRCVPGEAQLCIAWLRLAQLNQPGAFHEAACELLEHVKAAQLIAPARPELHGAISGSVPINGNYESYCLVNWGPKFLIDALLLKNRTDGASPTG